MSDGVARRMTDEEEMEYEMRTEYDLSKALPNPYPARARARAAQAKAADDYLVAIEPELFEKFPSGEAVNAALRSYLKQRERNAA